MTAKTIDPGADRHRFKSVAEDLRHLSEDWASDPPPDVVRRGSVILRRFLADGVLQRAWRAFGREREPIIPAPNLDEVLRADRENVVLALAGGGHTGGVRISGGVVGRGSAAPERDLGPDALEFPYRLSKFTESLSIWVPGGGVKRREVVQYFAHYEGGAHLHLSSRVRKQEKEMVRRVGTFKGIQIHEHEGLYFELLSIGQLMAGAPDIVGLTREMALFFGH